MNPYFTVEGVSRGFELYYRATSPLNTFGDSYQLATWGGNMRFGVPFTEIDTVFFGAGFEMVQIADDAFLPNSYFLYREEFGADSYSFPLTVGGRATSATARSAHQRRVLSGQPGLELFGDVQFLRLNLQAQKFIPMIYGTTLGLNGEIGWGLGLGSRPYPVFKNFYGGGLGSVRVFQQGSLGIIDPTGSFIGGTRKANANVQVYFPCLAGPGQEPARLRLLRRRQRLGRGRVGHLRQPACLGRGGLSAGYRRWAR